MDRLSERDFLNWAQSRGIAFSKKYPESRSLVFNERARLNRFWETPCWPHERPHFIGILLWHFGDWQKMHVWVPSGTWPTGERPENMNDRVEVQIHAGLGLPGGTNDCLIFDRTEIGKLVTLIFTTTVFSFCVAQDLVMVPDHTRHIIETDHHDVISVTFRDEDEIDTFVSKMEEAGYPLPTELPDETFKRPDWMKAQ